MIARHAPGYSGDQLHVDRRQQVVAVSGRGRLRGLQEERHGRVVISPLRVRDAQSLYGPRSELERQARRFGQLLKAGARLLKLALPFQAEDSIVITNTFILVWQGRVDHDPADLLDRIGLLQIEGVIGHSDELLARPLPCLGIMNGAYQFCDELLIECAMPRDVISLTF